MSHVFDVAVVGAGVVGAAIARALSHHRCEVVLLDAAGDVGAGTSKANTAILHTGFDATPGTLEAKLVARGHDLLGAYAREVGIAVEHTGALLVAWTAEQVAALPALLEKAHRNGVTDVAPVSVPELYAREPELGPGAQGGLVVPGESIIDPYSPPIAFATDAVENGATLLLRCAVTAVRSEGPHHVLGTSRGEVRARWVVNCAGLRSDELDGLFGHRRFRVTPRRGELIVHDKLARSRIRQILLPVPTRTTKGVLVSPTVFGNVLLGPTAEDLPDKGDTTTTAAGLEGLVDKGRRILPALEGEEVTATYAGLRAATEHTDYQVFIDPAARYLCVGGIRSTGLSASLALGEHALELLASAGFSPARKTPPSIVHIHMPPLGETQERPHRSAAHIEADPDFGRVVCHCERVTLGEVRRAAHAAIPARSLDGLRRRTRAMQGRCQGFLCLAGVCERLAEESGRSVESLLALEEDAP